MPLVEAGEAAAAREAFRTEGAERAAALDAATHAFLDKKREVGGALQASAQADYDEVRQIALGLAGAATALALLIGYFLSGSVAQAAGQVALAAKGLAVGDLDQSIDLRSHDELGQMAGAVREMIAYQQVMAQVAQSIAQGDLTQDLKNPLSGIKLTADLLRRRVARQPSAGPDQLLDGLDAIENTATRLLAQIEELLDVARLQVGRPLELQRRETDLVSLTRDMVAIYQYGTERHDIRVASSQPEVIGCWDAPRLERVVGNLVNNAIKYSPRGGPIIITIDVASRETQRDAVLNVRDEGIGIAADELPRIYDLFQRAEAVRGHIPGTGIGLATVRHIVELHGGSVTISSQPGNGTSVTIRLPAQLSSVDS